MSKSILAWAPAAFACLAVIFTPALAAFEPYSGGEAAAIFPPDWTTTEVFIASAEAGAPLVRHGASANIGIVQIETDEQARALRRAGAWLVINAESLGGCLIGPELAVADLSYDHDRSTS